MIDLYAITVGDLIVLKDGRQGNCIENMEDGQWIEIEFAGETELVHSQDIVRVEKLQTVM